MNHFASAGFQFLASESGLLLAVHVRIGLKVIKCYLHMLTCFIIIITILYI